MARVFVGAFVLIEVIEIVDYYGTGFLGMVAQTSMSG